MLTTLKRRAKQQRVISFQRGWGLGAYLSRNAEDGYGLMLHLVYLRITLALGFGRGYQVDTMIDLWGVALTDGLLMCHWREHTKTFQTPWAWILVRTCHYLGDRCEVCHPGGQSGPSEQWLDEHRWRKVHEVDIDTQSIQVTCELTRHEYQWYWLRWLPLTLARKRTRLSCDFEPAAKGVYSTSIVLEPNEPYREGLKRLIHRLEQRP